MVMLQIHQSNNFDFKTDPLVSKMVNLLMRNGKKTKAEKTLRHIFLFIEKNYPGEALNIFYLAVFHSQCLIGIRAKIKGKKSRRKIKKKETFVPYYLFNSRSQTIAIRSLFMAGRTRSQHRPIWENMSEEFIKAAFNLGHVVEKRYRIHKLAKDNKRLYPSSWFRKFEKKYN